MVGVGDTPVGAVTSTCWTGARKTVAITSERLFHPFAEREIFRVRSLQRSRRSYRVLRRAGIQLFVKEGNDMRPGTKNEVAGKVHEVKGKVKKNVGKLTNNPDLEVEGQHEKAGGKVQKKVGQVENVLENVFRN